MCIALIVCPSLYQYVVNVQIETKTSRHANMFSAFYGSIISHVTTQVCQEFFMCFEENNCYLWDEKKIQKSFFLIHLNDFVTFYKVLSHRVSSF